MSSVRVDVLHTLSTNETGLTERQVVEALRPKKRMSFDEEVEHRTVIARTLRTLKSEHRAWPTKKAGTKRWNITARGRRTY